MKRAIIVGSGIAGGMVARVLARSCEYSVLVLEKGRLMHSGLGGPNAGLVPVYANDELGYDQRVVAPFDMDPLVEPRSFRMSPADGARLQVGDVNDLPQVVGGATTHYAGLAPRNREVDFITNSLMGGTADHPAIPNTSYADWPIQYHHLEPFYGVSEELVGVQGPARRGPDGKMEYPNPLVSWRSTPFPMPPGVAIYSNLLMADAARRIGLHPAAVPGFVTSRPYRGRPACNDCGFCMNYGCTINAHSGGIFPLNEAMQTGRVELRPLSMVIRIEFASDRPHNGRFRVAGVTYLDNAGRSHFEGADLVIMANSPIEATRISLLSGIGSPVNEQDLTQLTPSVTDPSGMLGRNLMFHYQTEALAIVNLRIHGARGRMSDLSHAHDDFAGSGPSPAQFNPEVPIGGIVQYGSGVLPIAEGSIYATAGVYGERLKELMRISLLREHLIAMQMQGQDMPQYSNYVDLDPDIYDIYGQRVARITYQSHPYEIAAAQYYAPKMLELLEAVGGPASDYPQIEVLGSADVNAQVPTTAPTSRHIMGTHRFALDPDHGPTDPFGRYWAFDNLYHAGAGLYVTAPGFNPSLTIAALSYWMAAAIISGTGGRSQYAAADIDAAAERLWGVLASEDPDTMAARALARGLVQSSETGCAPAHPIRRGGSPNGSGASRSEPVIDQTRAAPSTLAFTGEPPAFPVAAGAALAGAGALRALRKRHAAPADVASLDRVADPRLPARRERPN